MYLRGVLEVILVIRELLNNQTPVKIILPNLPFVVGTNNFAARAIKTTLGSNKQARKEFGVGAKSTHR